MYDDTEVWEEINRLKGEVIELKVKGAALKTHAEELQRIHSEAQDTVDDLGKTIKDIKGIVE